MRRRSTTTLVALGALCLAAAVLRLLVGATGFGLPDAGIVWELRGWRMAGGLAVGASLAVGGVLLQALLRNPLAAPGIIGLSSGASFAVVLAMYVGWLAAGDPSSSSGGYLLAGWQALPAMLGSVGALALVYFLSQRRGLVDPTSLVLIGVMVSMVLGAATTLVQHLLPPQADFGVRAIAGSLSDDTPVLLIVAALALGVLGTGIGMWLGPTMDASSLSEDEAKSVGVDVDRVRLVLFVLAGVLAAGAVVVGGPIGFVGLLCPHLVRLLAGPAHRPLVLGAALAGGALVVGADTALEALPGRWGGVPLGVVMAVVGGPVFIGLLRSRA